MPNNFDNDVCSFTPRPGGEVFYLVQPAAGQTLQIHIENTAPSLLAGSVSVSEECNVDAECVVGTDADGNAEITGPSSVTLYYLIVDSALNNFAYTLSVADAGGK